jgi:hypothetical protein
LAERVRAEIGNLDSLYYAPTPIKGLSPRRNSTRNVPMEEVEYLAVFDKTFGQPSAIDLV